MSARDAATPAASGEAASMADSDLSAPSRRRSATVATASSPMKAVVARIIAAQVEANVLVITGNWPGPPDPTSTRSEYSSSGDDAAWVTDSTGIDPSRCCTSAITSRWTPEADRAMRTSWSPKAGGLWRISPAGNAVTTGSWGEADARYQVAAISQENNDVPLPVRKILSTPA